MKKNNLDERQEQIMLKIEHNGFWIAFWMLLAAMLGSAQDPSPAIKAAPTVHRVLPRALPPSLWCVTEPFRGPLI